jgi:hypothetical protein
MISNPTAAPAATFEAVTEEWASKMTGSLWTRAIGEARRNGEPNAFATYERLLSAFELTSGYRRLEMHRRNRPGQPT